MNKRNVLLSVTVTSMIAVTCAVLAINGGLENSSISATNGEVWHHYAAVAPTENTHGSKEFWASSADGCATHTFTNPDPGVTCIEHDFSTYDSFATLTWDDDRYVWSLNEQRDLGIIPVVTENTVTYGLYPQTNVNDESLITALNALTTPGTNGYYFHENAYYAKVSATVDVDFDFYFDNGAEIVNGTTYWFKCEPIIWNVLSNTNGVRYILSSVLLDASCYHYDTEDRWSSGKKIYPNNYEYSDIWEWLNIDFYKSAFALHNSYIQETTVDNRASTTDSSENPYACNNTEDKVFLPSYQDYINSDYGFATSPDSTATRYCKTTDWARARGAWYSDDDSYQYNGYYWTRSPYSENSQVAWSVDEGGCFYNGDFVSLIDTSVRPALSIKIA